MQAIFPGHPRLRLANPSDPAHLIIDVTADIEKKLAAALCHHTQHALFVRRPSQEQGHPMTVREVIEMTKAESLRRQIPASDGFPDDALGKLLQNAGVLL